MLSTNDDKKYEIENILSNGFREIRAFLMRGVDSYLQMSSITLEEFNESETYLIDYVRKMCFACGMKFYTNRYSKDKTKLKLQI